MKFDDVSKLRDVTKYLENIKEKSLVIYSKTSIIKNNIPINNKNFILISTHEITKKIDNIKLMLEKIKEFEMVISIGGGTAIDIGKYISFLTSKKMICIPTMLSTNSYSTDKVSLINNKNKKITLNAKIPDLILIDDKIMRNVKSYNLYGIADILSIYTDLNDWNFAIKYNNEDKNEIYNMSKRLLNKTIKYILNNNYEDIINNPEKIFYLVGEAGHITNIYGSGKPESGSEHIFAKELESLIEIPHGIAVSYGIVLMSIAQDKFDNNIYNCLKKLKLFEEGKKFRLNYNLIEQAFENITPRLDRYTIVNTLYNNETKKEEVLNKFKELEVILC